MFPSGIFFSNIKIHRKKMKQPTSSKPRKQRKWLFEMPLGSRQNMVASTLSEELRTKYKRRSVQVRKGDKVKVMRGDFKGTVGEVTKVVLKDMVITIQGINLKKADGTEVPRPIAPSNVMITELFTEDPERRNALERKLAPATSPSGAKKPAKK
jgi:large subunit ribosomal protein L24